MAGLAPTNPSNKGLYINSFKISATDTSPYTNLLGTDGLGAYPAGSGGNKINDLITYMLAQGYNYAIFYGLDGSAFVNSSSDETFTTLGKQRLQNIIARFKTAGITSSAVVNLASLNRTASRWDGTSQVRKIVEYNNTATNNNQKFEAITVETEFWNFNHSSATTSAKKLEITSSPSGGLPGRGLANTWSGSILDPFPCGNTSNAILTLSPNVADHDFIKVISATTGATTYREVVNRTLNGANAVDVEFDFDLPSGFNAGNCVYYDTVLGSDTPPYEVFLQRVVNCRAYLIANAPTLVFELYTGFPDYTNDGALQLSTLFYSTTKGPGFHRILLTNYHRIPNFDYVNGGSGANRVTGDALQGQYQTELGLRELGFIVSAESPTLNARGCDDPVSNFSGYFLEGRSLNTTSAVPLNNIFRPTTVLNGGTEITSTNYCGGNCCTVNTIFRPPVSPTYTPKNLQNCWEYTLTTPPTSSGDCPSNSQTWNQQYSSFAATTNKSRANWTTIVVFTQSLVRQLNVVEPPAECTFTATPTNTSCKGSSTGKIDIYFYGCTGSRTITLTPTSPAGSPTVVSGLTSSSYTFNNLPEGTYTVGVTGIAVSGTNPKTVVVGSDNSTWTGAVSSYQYKNGCSSDRYAILTTAVTGGTAPINVRITNAAGSSTIAGPVTYTNQTDLSTLGLYYPSDGNNYKLVFTDALGCTYILTLVGNSFTNPLTIDCTVTNLTCSGGSNGSLNNISVNAPGTYTNSGTIVISKAGVTIGTYPYTPGTSPAFTVTELSAGTYVLTYTDSFGCTCTTTKTITAGSPITISAAITNVTCYYCKLNGAINITVSGGSGNYSYSWSNGATSEDLTQLCPGVYTVLVTDTNGCKATATYTLGSGLNPINVVSRVVDILEGSTNGGAIYIDQVTGGVASPVGYSYEWTGPNGYVSTSQNITNLKAGTYTVTICALIGLGQQSGCCLTKEFTLGYKCPTFTLEELKVMLYKFQCCAGSLAKKYVQYQNIGRPDLAECLLIDLKYMDLALNALYCIDSLIDPQLSCEDITNIINQMNKICDCDCCQTPEYENYYVNYNPDTGSFDVVTPGK